MSDLTCPDCGAMLLTKSIWLTRFHKGQRFTRDVYGYKCIACTYYQLDQVDLDSYESDYADFMYRVDVV